VNGEASEMRVLVTGGAGFLGSHLSKRLLELGHEVLAVDNYYTGRKANLESCLNNSNFELLRHDITSPLNVEVDAIYNLACPASPVHYQKFPVQTMKTNVLGAINMLDLAKRLECKILQSSTSEIYGDPLISPQVEEHWGNVNPVGIRSCYDEGKRAAETLFMDYHHQFNVDIAIARIFNTYGPQMAVDDGRVVSNFILQALMGEPITIYGDGSQSRSFCFVDDLISGLISLFESDLIGPVNIGNPNEFTMLELANVIIELSGSKSKIVFHPLPSDDPKQRQPDISMATRELNWEPQIQLREGLLKTMDYFKKFT
jgi:UDP-glucuronate decarboxylase